MKKLMLCMLTTILSLSTYADDLGIFQSYAQKADSAFSKGNLELCFKTEEDLLELFKSKRKKYIRNNDICLIAFNAFSYLATLDKRKTDKDVCELLANGLSLIDDNPSWIHKYPNKQTIIDNYVNLIGICANISNTTMACKYNQDMISFTEKYYKYELPSVLLTACSMYSLMHKFDNNYPLYKRLYEMFDDLDRLQQYEVVKGLIIAEFRKGNYHRVSELSLKHENLIASTKDEVKDDVLKIIKIAEDKCYGKN